MTLAAVTTALNTVGIHEVPDPVPGADEALIRVEAVGVCGTDLHIYDGGYAAPLPLVQGHEISGVVEALPPGYAGPVQVGSRIAVEPVVACGTCRACRVGRHNTCVHMDAIGVRRPGGFQTLMSVPVANCHPVGDLSADVAALCETLSVSQRAVARPAVGPTDQVVILGAGPIGLGALIAVLDCGAESMVVDLHDSRLALARELGAAETVRGLDAVDERVGTWSGGAGASVVIEATGAAVVAEKAFDIVATTGRISIVGVSEQRASLNLRTFTAKELDVFGSRSTVDFPGAIALAQRHPDAVRRLVSHRYPLNEVGTALAFAHDHPKDVIKALIEVSAG